MNQKTAYFLEIFDKAYHTYGSDPKRLAGEGWDSAWKTLIVTVMSAQARDETTIPISEELFTAFPTLEALSEAKFVDVLHCLRSLNYNRTKSKNIIAAAQHLLRHHSGVVPQTMDELLEVPGVGRKTANLVLAECFGQDSICVDTHVHRISNVFGFVKTNTPQETEFALMKLVPKEYWSKINRIFVLWGKEVTGWDKEKFLDSLQ